MPHDVQPPGFLVRHDCRHYSGYRPCGYNPVCEGCTHFAPIGKRVLIIKLAAMGDVLRTTPVTTAIRKQWPDAHITWVTMPESCDLLRCNPDIDRLLEWNADSVLYLETLEFDLLLNLDKELSGLALGERVKAADKRGFCLNSAGQVGITDERAGYALQLGLDDHLKFHENTKTVQQVVCEMVGLEWEGDLYVFKPGNVSRSKCGALLNMPELKGKIPVAISTGCGPGFPTKRWAEENVLDFVEEIASWPDVVALLCGGKGDADLNRRLIDQLGSGVIDMSTDNTLEEFIGILMASAAVVTVDSLPMHIGVALGKPVVALFGPTTSREVDVGPLGEIVGTEIDCAPCYLKRCPQTETGEPLCMEQMSPEQVCEALRRALAKREQ